jgi:hypothetical protein
MAGSLRHYLDVTLTAGPQGRGYSDRRACIGGLLAASQLAKTADRRSIPFWT